MPPIEFVLLYREIPFISAPAPRPPPPNPDIISPLIVPLTTKLGNGLANIKTSTHWWPWLLGFTFWCRTTTLCHPFKLLCLYLANSQNETHFITVVIRLHFFMQNNHVVPPIELLCLYLANCFGVCAPIFIFTSGSSALFGCPCCGLSIWLSLLAIFNTQLFWVYANFFHEKTDKTRGYSKSAGYTKIAADGYQARKALILPDSVKQSASYPSVVCVGDCYRSRNTCTGFTMVGNCFREIGVK